MQNYQYIASDESGHIRRGEMYASERSEFYENLAKERRHCILYRTRKKTAPRPVRCAFKNKQLLLFCQKLSAMLTCGVRIDAALSVLGDSTRNKKAQQSVRLLCSDIQEGELLSLAMTRQKKNYPPILIHAVVAGEESGMLDQCMEYMSGYFKREQRLRESLVTAAIYPLILLGLTAVIVTLLFAFFLPSMQPMFAGSELPEMTRNLFNISAFFQEKWRTVAAGCALAAMAVVGVLQIKAVRRFLDKMLVKLPGLALFFRTVYTARFSQSMTVLRRSSVPIDEAVEMAGNALNNRYIAGRLRETRRAVGEGSRLCDALEAAGVFDKLFPSMILTGEEGSSLDRVFQICSDYYGEELDTLIKKVIALMEPMFILLLGVLVGFVVISVMLPMYDMMGSILP